MIDGEINDNENCTIASDYLCCELFQLLFIQNPKHNPIIEERKEMKSLTKCMSL